MPAIYSPKDVTVIVNGEYITGFAEGTFVTIEKDEDSISPSVGAQGDVAVAISCNNLHSATFILQQTSPSVATLDRLHKAGNMFTVSVTCKSKDGSIDESFDCESALVKKPATRNYSNEIESREYSIQCLDGYL